MMPRAVSPNSYLPCNSSGELCTLPNICLYYACDKFYIIWTLRMDVSNIQLIASPSILLSVCLLPVLFFCLHVHLSLSLFIYQSAFLTVFRYLFLFVRFSFICRLIGLSIRFIHIFICLTVLLFSLHLYLSLSVYMFPCLYFCQSMRLSIYPLK